MKLLRWASASVVSLVVVACGGAKHPPPVAPQAAAPTAVAAAPSPDPAPAPVAMPVPEAEIKTFLAAKAGEEPADAAPIPGISELTAKESATLARCEGAKRKAIEKSAKLPVAKQIAAAMKAMEKADKHCLDLGMRESSQAMAKDRDVTAQTEMHTLARALAKTTTCDKGAANPHRSYGCFASSTFLWDREGWSCLGKSLTEQEKDAFASGTAYSYSFRVDEELKTFEIVGQGCGMILGSASDAKTELVLRGRLGQPAEAVTILRRASTKDPR